MREIKIVCQVILPRISYSIVLFCRIREIPHLNMNEKLLYGMSIFLFINYFYKLYAAIIIF